MSKCEKTELNLLELDRIEESRELSDAELEAVAGGKDAVVVNRRPGGFRPPVRRPR